MTQEFCPRSEVRKLEQEFHELKQDGGDNLAYNNRFHELSLLCPDIVTPWVRCLERYTDGLPPLIRDSVLSSKPTNLTEAIQMAATLTEGHVRAGTLTRKGSKKGETKSSSEPTPKS